MANEWNKGVAKFMGNIYLYSDIPTNGGRDLAAALGATRLRKFDGMDFWRRKHRIVMKPEDVVICWGKLLPLIDGLRMLNSGKNMSKIEEMWALVNADIPTVTAAEIHKIVAPKEGFIGRSKYHVGGDDLLRPPARPDFWVKKETLVKEYRIHSFNERSIRAGIKQPRDGFTLAPSVEGFRMGVNAHPWIRSYDAGWRINYDEFESNKDLRSLAHKAVKALGLNFGAVDIGERADGSRLVLEVNKAPGLEGGTIEAYKRSIEKWVAEGMKEAPKEVPKEAVPDGPYRNPLDAREERYGRPRFPAAAPPVRPHPGQIVVNIGADQLNGADNFVRFVAGIQQPVQVPVGPPAPPAPAAARNWAAEGAPMFRDVPINPRPAARPVNPVGVGQRLRAEAADEQLRQRARRNAANGLRNPAPRPWIIQEDNF